jgi:ribosomal protein L21E
MTTLNIENTIKAGSYHKRSSGKTGQVLASTKIENKLVKVEALYRKYHEARLGRCKFYDVILEVSREVKTDAGGFIQHTAEAVAGVVLRDMQKTLTKALKRKNKSKPVSLEIGTFKIGNLRDLAQAKRGRPAA